MMNKGLRKSGGWIEALFAIIIGVLLFTSIPELKIYFDNLVGAIFAGIIGGIIVAAIIFVGWFIIKSNQN